MSAESWQSFRRIIQVLSLGFFLYLSIQSIYAIRFGIENVFFRLNPLTGFMVMLAGRVWIPAFAIGGITLILTLLFGRVWCGWICPLGTLVQILGPKNRKPFTVSESWRSVKYILLCVTIFAGLFGSISLILFDPIANLNRTLSAAVWPAIRAAVLQTENFFYQFEILWGVLDWFHQAVSYPLLLDIQPVFINALAITLLFLFLVGLNWLAVRFWCRYLCPSGALLGLISRFSLTRRVVNNSCSGCGICNYECPTGTINPQKSYQSDPAECLVCHNCMVNCYRNSASFVWQIPIYKAAARQEYDPGRRAILASFAAAAGAAALANIEPVVKGSHPNLIYPPGAALPEFYSLCIRCSECIRVCPTQGLQLTFFETGWQNLFTPRLVPRLGYCMLNCKACVDACPTGALIPMDLEQKQSYRIGLASIDKNRCLPWAYATPCIVCEEVCPMADKAIGLQVVHMQDESGNSISIQQPYIKGEFCTGCGICEFKCPVSGEAAIRVFPPSDLVS